jgi:hypothetical protein
VWLGAYSSPGTTTSPSITSPTVLTQAEVGTAYNFQMAAAGLNPGPVAWLVLSGTIPAGLTFSSAGLISGTPTVAETESFVVQVVDSLGQASAPTSFSLTVASEIIPGPPPQAMFPGYVDSQSVNFMWWPPTTQTAWYGANFTGFISGSVLTVLTPGSGGAGTYPITGALAVGQLLSNVNTAALLPAFVHILSFGTGTGGTGTYNLDTNCGTVASQSMYTNGAGTPDYYRVYANGTLVCGGATNTASLLYPGVTASPIVVNAQTAAGVNHPVGWYTYRVAPSATPVPVTFTVTAVTGGAESAPGPPLTMTPLANGTTSVLPTLPADPSTWMAPFTLPGASAGGKTYLCTNYTADPSGAITGTFTGNVCSGCSFQGALNQAVAAGGNSLIVLYSPVGGGSAYAQPAGGCTLANSSGVTFSGASGWTYICSDQDPVYQASIGGTGALPAYAYTLSLPYPQVVNCTASLTAGATSATMLPNQSGYVAGTVALTDSSGNWLLKSGWYYVIFREGTGTAQINEERLCVFTKGSPTFTWTANNGHYVNTGNTTGGLNAAALAVVQVDYLTGVTPYDAPNMPLFNVGLNGTGINVPPLCTKVRLTGIHWVPNAVNTQQATDIIHFQNPGGTPIVDYPPAESIYVERCLFGADTGSATYGFCAHGIAGVNCNHFLSSQNYCWGIATNFLVSSGDANNFTTNGAYQAWLNNYISCVAECHITGGIYIGQANQPTQFVSRYNRTHKPLGWAQGANIAIATWTASGPVGATGCTLAAVGQYANGWPYPSGTYPVDLSLESVTGTFVNGSAAVSFSTALAHADLQIMNVRGSTPYGIFGQEVKNHWEQKAGTVYQYLGNVGLNNWVGRASGYHGSMFALGARDQTIAGPSTNLSNCSSWNTCTDITLTTNVGLNLGCFLVSFTSDEMPNCYDARVQATNNLGFINPAVPITEPGYNYRIYGPSSDHILSNNTILVNQQLPTASIGVTKGFYFIALSGSAGGYITPGPVPYGPNPTVGATGTTTGGYTNYLDRLTFTNNIVDSGPGAGYAMYRDAGYPALAALPNVTFSGNLTITDTQGYSGVISYPNVSYGSVGFTNVPSTGPTVIPYYPSDWDVPGGTYAGQGATFTNAQLSFPLLGQYYIGGSTAQQGWGTPSVQSQIANLDVIVAPVYPGYSYNGYTANSAAAAIKALNPNIKICWYVIWTTFESGQTSGSGAWGAEWTICNTDNYFLRATWPSGTIQTQGGSGQCLNVTTSGVGNVTTPYNAQRPIWSVTDGNEWASNFDGIYIDNFNSVSPVPPSPGTADFLQNGTGQTPAAETTIWQNGMADMANNTFAALTAAGAPSAQVWGNSATWNPPVTAYTNLLTGGVMESIMGQSFSYESQSGGWTTMMNYYKGVMNATIATNGAKYQLFSMEASSSTAYTALRYGICSCLMDNAYWGVDYATGTTNYTAINATDETAFNLGVQIAGPNSTVNGTYSNGGLTVWKQGVWRRDFANGIALVNPRGNGAQTVTLETTYYLLTSTTGDPVNTGAAVTSVTLADSNVAGTGGDGRILSRTPT